MKTGILEIYIIMINLITFFMFMIDKEKAKRNRWRIRESVLLGLSLIGGAAGGLIGMKVCHHKTMKPKFFIGVPLMLFFQIALMIYFR
jgi:uncharacterized membrane protein YsdA (DUF1294 family)